MKNKRRFRNHCIIIGGHKDPSERSDKKDESNFKLIHFVDTKNLEQSVSLAEQFNLSPMLPLMVDQFTAILKDPRSNDGYYLRTTFPLRVPIQVGNVHVHYIVF